MLRRCRADAARATRARRRRETARTALRDARCTERCRRCRRRAADRAGSRGTDAPPPPPTPWALRSRDAGAFPARRPGSPPRSAAAAAPYLQPALVEREAGELPALRLQRLANVVHPRAGDVEHQVAA